MNGHHSRTRAVAAQAETVAASRDIPFELAGRRLDQALAEMFPDWSRSRLQGWLRDGTLRVDGGVAAPRQRVMGGEHIELKAELAPVGVVVPQDLPVDVRYRDDDLMVIVKPAGLVVHPGAGNADGTLQNALLHLDPSLAVLPRAGIVHRLDKDTSGLMVVARSLRAHAALVAMLARHEVLRQYEAVVVGALISGGDVDAPLGRSRNDRLRERFRAHSVIQCNLETGRTHQIRVHMAHVGHPLVGDPLYGGGLRLPRGATEELTAALRGFQRQALHAERLEFEHPVDGRLLHFEAERPTDMTALIEALRADTAAAEARR